MQAVYKYTLRDEATTVVILPAGAKFLSAQNHQERVVAWFLVTLGAPKVERRFRLILTGHAITMDDAIYLATIQQDGGCFVQHLFELP